MTQSDKDKLHIGIFYANKTSKYQSISPNLNFKQVFFFILVRELQFYKGPFISVTSLFQQYNFVCEFRELYEEYKKENDAEQRSISR